MEGRMNVDLQVSASEALGFGVSQLRAYLNRFADFPDSEIDDLVSVLRLRKFGPHENFTRIGDTHDLVGFVLRGLFRIYYISQDGGLHVRGFCAEGYALGSYATIISSQPAHVNIEALEPSLVLQLAYSEISKRFDKHPAWERLGRRLAEYHYISRETREYQFLAFDAAERYDKFLEDFPGFEQRISQTNIASYIGVAPETLSRIIRKRGLS
jgi:CRP-like cAMP-binding protein